LNPQPGRPSSWALAYKYTTLTLVWAYVASIVLRGDGGYSPMLEIGLVNTILLLLAASLWVRSFMPNPNRAAIAWLAVASSGYLIGNLSFAAYTLAGVPAPLPSVADIGYSLAFLGLSVAAALALRRERHRHDVRIILDVILGFLGAVVLASVLLRPVIETLLHTASLGLLSATLSQIAYPLFDMVVLAMFVGKITLTKDSDRRMWIFVAAGVALLTIGDLVYAREAILGTYVFGGPLDASWVLGWWLIAWGAWHGPRTVPVESPSVYAPMLMSGLATAIAVGTLVLAAFNEVYAVSVWLATIVLLLVVVQTVLNYRGLARLTRVQHQAMTDELTGLANRRALFKDLPRRLEAFDPTEPILVAIADLDGFKEVNDELGHHAGDRVLQSVATSLFADTRTGDFVGRLGGDEFAILCQLNRRDDPARVMERIAAAIARAGDMPGVELKITASVGGTTVMVGDDADAVLRRADQAMYRAKTSGSGTALSRS
jgi:diguanylate cyclase (GGDEF)-like protein